MKDINPTDLTNSAHSMKNKHRENYAQEPNSQPAEKIKHIKKKKKRHQHWPGGKGRNILKNAQIKMNSNSSCPTEGVVPKKVGGGSGGGNRKRKQTKLRKINDFSEIQKTIS